MQSIRQRPGKANYIVDDGDQQPATTVDTSVAIVYFVRGSQFELCHFYN